MMVVSSSDSTAKPELDSSGDATRDRIIQAAARVFAEQGYARATTRALAAEAGVNEVTLFRRFGNKQSLFAAVVDEYAASALTSAVEAQLTGDYRRDLLTMGRLVMRALLERSDAVRLMLCEATHFPELRDVMVENPRQLRRMVARYLEAQMENGTIRPGHPEVLAQAFIGMFFSYAVSLDLLAEPVQPEASLEEITEQFVATFVRGTIAAEE